jgi:hypothetical protein
MDYDYPYFTALHPLDVRRLLQVRATLASAEYDFP